jgi:hypothetical protein
VTGWAWSATIHQEAARRSPSSREFAAASSSGFNDLARACPTVPPILGHRTVVFQDNRARLQPAPVRAGIPATLSTSARRARSRLSASGTIGARNCWPAWTGPLPRGAGADVRDSPFCDRTGNPAARASSASRWASFGAASAVRSSLSSSDRCPNASHGRPRAPPSAARVWQAARPLPPPRAPPRPRACRRRLPGRGRGSREARCPAPAA